MNKPKSDKRMLQRNLCIKNIFNCAFKFYL